MSAATTWEGAMHRFRLTYANVASTLALVLALGGGAYAATSQSGTQGRVSTAAVGPAVLGHSHTEIGVFNAGGMSVDSSIQTLQLSAVTFPTPLAFFPVGHILDIGQKTKACPGTVRKPAAKPGHLCIYEGGNWSIGSVTFIDARTQGSAGVTKWGFILSATPYTSSGSFSFSWHGTWAVTAP